MAGCPHRKGKHKRNGHCPGGSPPSTWRPDTVFLPRIPRQATFSWCVCKCGEVLPDSHLSTEEGAMTSSPLSREAAEPRWAVLGRQQSQGPAHTSQGLPPFLKPASVPRAEKGGRRAQQKPGDHTCVARLPACSVPPWGQTPANKQPSLRGAAVQWAQRQQAAKPQGSSQQSGLSVQGETPVNRPLGGIISSLTLSGSTCSTKR